MSKTCDVSLEGKFTVHLSIIPSLGLIVINELDDFAENWIETKIVSNSKLNPQYDIRVLSGGLTDDGAIQAASRYFIDIIHKGLYEKARPSSEQIGLLLKFIINFSLRPEILANRHYVTSLGTALGALVSSYYQEG